MDTGKLKYNSLHLLRLMLSCMNCKSSFYVFHFHSISWFWKYMLVNNVWAYLLFLDMKVIHKNAFILSLTIVCRHGLLTLFCRIFLMVYLSRIQAQTMRQKAFQLNFYRWGFSVIKKVEPRRKWPSSREWETEKLAWKKETISSYAVKSIIDLFWDLQSINWKFALHAYGITILQNGVNDISVKRFKV